MKKFFVLCMLAFAMLIPTAVVEAADVPSFYQIVGRYLTFTGKEVGKKKPTHFSIRIADGLTYGDD